MEYDQDIINMSRCCNPGEEFGIYLSKIDKIADKLSDLDLLILALSYAEHGKPIRDDLFFQKEMFLVINFIKEMKPSADFIPHILGPYSEPLEISLKGLSSIKLVEKKPNGYQITDLGKEIFEKISQKISPEKLEAIEDFKQLLNDVSKDELLVFVYFSYPDMRVESAVFNDVNRKRVPASISLYKKGKISLEKAAFLSGLSIEKFIDILKEMNETPCTTCLFRCDKCHAFRRSIPNQNIDCTDYVKDPNIVDV